MAKLIYTAIMSLDGFIEDETGKFDWAFPSEEVHAFVNAQERSVGTHLYGRRMYETMMVWETEPSFAQESPFTQDYAQIWQAADKIVFSRTLQSPSTTRTTLEREFDAERVRKLKASAERDLAIGGANLAAEAFKAGLVDTCRLFVVPVSVGGGKPAMPRGVRVDMELRAERRFDNGTVFMEYQTSVG